MSALQNDNAYSSFYMWKTLVIKRNQLLRHMLKLRGGTVTNTANDEIFRMLFLQKLPLTIRMALVVYKDASLSELADMA